MRLPNLLLIGAMKSGTTSLYMDLVDRESVYLAENKEPQVLCTDAVLTQVGSEQYAAIYSKAGPEQLLCDASTEYAKRPDHEGISKRAVEILPKDFKVVYIVRHPIERIISQHYHEFTEGLVGPSIDEVVRHNARYVNYSRYAYQLEPWVKHVGLDRIHVIKFEDYIAHRNDVLQSLCDFLGLSEPAASVDEAKVYNKSDGKPVANSFWSRVAKSWFYRQIIRRLVPIKLRLTLYGWLLPSAPERPARPQPETLEWLQKELAEDVLQLQSLLNLKQPFWEDWNTANE